MLSGSALLRVALLIAVVGGLAALAQRFWPGGAALPEKPFAVASVAAPTRRTEPPPRPAELTSASVPKATQDLLPARPPLSAARTAGAETLSLFDAQPMAREPPAPASSAARTTAVAKQDVASAEDGVVPRAVDLVDLNSAALAELNGLRGGGAVGRAIVQHRPYAAIDQLLSKRVLSRATYLRIKDQVTVR